ncbi:TetR-like C-terminal domain-containing protein [Lentibacillus sp. L22]|uniref:TetR-like C-terminal domain-containing protein n=1 Tax=Lentibacillus TaxID=175304 RepID=UPI0022B135DD|nr:TetR-like C-terminal domain-containing protein [Lentibacillus daqui]
MKKLFIDKGILLTDMELTFKGKSLMLTLWWLQKDMPYTPRYMAELLRQLDVNGPYIDNPFFKSTLLSWGTNA